MALYCQNKEQENENQKLFDKTIQDYLSLSILNNLREDLNINNIPFKDIRIGELEKIIK